MNKRIYIFLIMLCFCFVQQPVAFAQQPVSEEEMSLEKSKKTPSIFKRPKKKTPAEQLEFANMLKKNGYTSKAMKQYRALVHKWHESPEAANAQLEYAKLLEASRKYSKAFDEFQYLIDYFAGDFEFDKALDHQFRIANYIMTTKRGKFLFFPGFNAPEDAIPLLEAIVKNGPTWEKTPEAQYYIGLIHEQGRSHEEAIKAYTKVSDLYARSSFAEEASFNRAHCFYTISKANPRDEKNCQKAVGVLVRFTKDYPSSNNIVTTKEYLNELETRLAQMYFDRAVFYDKTAKKPEAAIITYKSFIKKFPDSELAEKADERIDFLKKELEELNR